MGIGPPLPAPTDPSSRNSAVNTGAVDTDLATDLSQLTERTSYSLPSDGSPITIPTRPKRLDRDPAGKLARPSHHSQTSLLIELFEGGKGRNNLQARPSVRVKVTPSSGRKAKTTNDHIRVSEAGQTRQPSYSKRIPLPLTAKGDQRYSESAEDDDDDNDDSRSVSSVASATQEAGLQLPSPPIEVEVLHHDDDLSPISAAASPRNSRYVQPNPSEISAMPPESSLGPVLPTNPASRPLRRVRSRSMDRDAEIVASSNRLTTPSRPRSRSLSRERIVQKVLEQQKARESNAAHHQHRSSKSRSHSLNKELAEPSKTTRRRSGKTQHRMEEPHTSSTESARLTTSQLSPSRKSGDQYSLCSTASKSSLNPRLLATVEDAIKRLILPELSVIKQEQLIQQNRNKFEEGTRDSTTTGSGPSREGSRRRVSKVSSAPDVVGAKPKVVLNQDESGRAIVLLGDSVKSKKERRSGSRDVTASPSEKSSNRQVSQETLTPGKVRGMRSRDRPGVADDASSGAGTALTAAALRHHESKSSVDQNEMRHRRNKSRSRSASLAEEGAPPVPAAADVNLRMASGLPPMPLSSEIHGSEVTRESLLTAPTERLLSAPDRRNAKNGEAEVADPEAMEQEEDNIIGVSGYRARAIGAGLAAAAAAAPSASHATANYGQQHVAADDHYVTHHRSLSPIQSVASSKDESLAQPPLQKQHSLPQSQSAESLSSSLDRRSPSKHSDLSLDSVSTSQSSKVAQEKRARSLHEQRNLAARDSTSHDSDGSALSEEATPKGRDARRWHDNGNAIVHHGIESDVQDPVDAKHMTHYTEDSMDGLYMYKMAAGQEVLGVGQNPEYRHTPVAVSSAVASLHNASAVDVHSTRSGQSKAVDGPYADSINEARASMERPSSSRHGTPTRRRRRLPGDAGGSNTSLNMARKSLEGPVRTASEKSLPKSESPVVMLGASSLPIANDPMPELGHIPEEESEINTNPSIIQGPIGGVVRGNRDHWPYDPTPPQTNGHFAGGHTTPGDQEQAHGLSALAGEYTNHNHDLGLDFAAQNASKPSFGRPPTENDGYTDGVNHDFGTRRGSYQHDAAMNTTPLKDEGYITADNPRSPDMVTPEYRRKGADYYEDDQFDGMVNGVDHDDPFLTHSRHVSGNSHGMPSPLYDSATGNGIDRIQSKDIVALMDHLTVRDAQRNARDTELLVTLVRCAAEMRNSFEDVKKLLAEQEMNIIEATDKNTERSVQKIISGPRPQPFTPRRVPRRATAEEDAVEDTPTKRKNVFRRALKGLSMRSSNDLSKIEDMLMQLLGDVESLKVSQETRPSVTRIGSMQSYDNVQTPRDGYEPEGQAGTGPSNQSNSGYFSNPPSRQASAMKGLDSNRLHEHRISTVPEGDEELADETPVAARPNYENPDHLLPPGPRHVRGSSMPLDSPSQEVAPVPAAAQSHENTPRTDKSKKHKSAASSFFPKISRWSETTASTVAKQFRGGRKDKEYLEAASRSGSDLGVYQYNQQELQEGDRIRSTYSLNEDAGRQGDGGAGAGRPPSPLIPQAAQEGPKYQAHRDSRDLHHPQPRQGPTQRYQHQLESQAQHFDSPVSPSSDQWTSTSNLGRFSGGAGNRQSGSGGGGVGGGHLSPISDTGYSQSPSAAAAAAGQPPPRPAKIPEEPLMPLVPQRSFRSLSRDHQAQQHPSPSAVAAAAYNSNNSPANGLGENRLSVGSGSSQMNGSPRSTSGRIPQRKPTGPRPISSNR